MRSFRPHAKPPTPCSPGSRSCTGRPKYCTADWDAARRFVVTLDALEPERVITGHGPPLQGKTLHIALHRLAAEFDSLAVHNHGCIVEHPAHAADGSAYKVPS